MPFCQLEGEFRSCERACSLIDTCSCHAILGYVLSPRLSVLILRGRQVACPQVSHVWVGSPLTLFYNGRLVSQYTALRHLVQSENICQISISESRVLNHLDWLLIYILGVEYTSSSTSSSTSRASFSWVIIFPTATFGSKIICFISFSTRLSVGVTCFPLVGVMWPTAVATFLWMGYLHWTFLFLWKISVRCRYGLSHLSALRRSLRPLLFGLTCFEKPYIFHRSFWQLGWATLEAWLLSCCRESRTASGLWWWCRNLCSLRSFQAPCDKWLRMVENGWARRFLVSVIIVTFFDASAILVANVKTRCLLKNFELHFNHKLHALWILRFNSKIATSTSRQKRLISLSRGRN